LPVVQSGRPGIKPLKIFTRQADSYLEAKEEDIVIIKNPVGLPILKGQYSLHGSPYYIIISIDNIEIIG